MFCIYISASSYCATRCQGGTFIIYFSSDVNFRGFSSQWEFHEVFPDIIHQIPPAVRQLAASRKRLRVNQGK